MYITIRYGWTISTAMIRKSAYVRITFSMYVRPVTIKNVIHEDLHLEDVGMDLTERSFGIQNTNRLPPFDKIIEGWGRPSRGVKKNSACARVRGCGYMAKQKKEYTVEERIEREKKRLRKRNRDLFIY